MFDKNLVFAHRFHFLFSKSKSKVVGMHTGINSAIEFNLKGFDLKGFNENPENLLRTVFCLKDCHRKSL